MPDEIYLSVVIPVYNEEKKIEKDLEMVFEYFQKQSYRFETIIVNDGSRDQTLQKLETLRKKYPQIKVVDYQPNRGKGHAVKTGILESQGKFILFADAGGCVPFRDMEKGMAILQDGYDIAIGSRGLKESRILVYQKLYRQVGAKLFWILVRFFLGIQGISDTQCGFKLFRREAAGEIFKLQKISGFMFDVEWILRAQMSGMKMKEFPIQWTSDMDSRFHPFPGAFRVFWDVVRVKFNSLRGK